ncbi:hypothetical protein IWW57_004564 [Coemansia sp. S610]|nr:hypothetical protein LPJ60_003964 [Coemansia sp. RSA 2675]KAJ2022338.1 hypothetical protein IWW57_004564 [Coemansia sp. S610]KAJ2374777.1 hypothetical protein H4S02_008434 [Coemansia sp. RSA 2611]KAJ2414682.1 hypothetical protein GGI10_002215 [Coemansia sp. RSA 2530]KAJ2698293.1 hypothetical protein H4218_003376 [Coemansia sp. IMI 209128]
MIKAVIFDVGGVLVQSPFIAISAYEQELGLPANYINVSLSRRGPEGAFQQYERGELAFTEFVDQWTNELNDTNANNTAFRRYLQRNELDTRMALPQQTRVSGATLFARMMAVAETPNECVVELVRWLKACGYRVAALTNNFKDAGDSDRLKPLFDVFVESAVEGLRKPDPRFYLKACERLRVGPSEALFLDDIPVNLRAAKALGMEAVRVEIGRETLAVDQVKHILRTRGAYPPPAKI